MNTLIAITWSVSPEIFSIGPITLRWYGLFFAFGFLFGYWMTQRVFRAEGVKEEWLDSLLIYLVLGTIIGARLGHVLFYNPDYYLSNPLEILKIWTGGLASHGGTAGVIFAMWLWSRRIGKRPMLWITDRIAMSVGLVSCFIRLGNLMNSEIIGNETDVPWAFIFTARDELARHPAQLYESIAYFSVFVILTYMFWKTPIKKKQGFITGFFLVMVFGWRFILEPFKIEQAEFDAGFLDILSMGQWLSIPFVLLGLYWMYKGWTSPPVEIVEKGNKAKKKN